MPYLNNNGGHTYAKAKEVAPSINYKNYKPLATWRSIIAQGTLCFATYSAVLFNKRTCIVCTIYSASENVILMLTSELYTCLLKHCLLFPLSIRSDLN